MNKLMNARDDILVLDVRNSCEYNSGFILGAKNLPIEKIKKASQDLPLDKNKTFSYITQMAYVARKRLEN
ncbi:MAG: hypothetical protein K0R18_1800 [Bacillales bacterium]|jgi:rhodanese-related sulfurtransferase|nr:hypothetical protein [Bacillales bacterium]